MKKILFTTLFFVFCTLQSQTKKQIKHIIKHNNKTNLEKLLITSKIEDSINKVNVSKFLRDNPNKSEIIYDIDGSFCQLYKIENDKPIYKKLHNTSAARSTRANLLYNGGYLNLDIEGQNMNAYVWDGSRALETHNEFVTNGNSKILSGDTTDTGLSRDHATHVSGTICAKGDNPLARGTAPKSNVFSYDWFSDITEANIAATTNGMLLSNHSYGDMESSIDDWRFGAYSNDSRTWDALMYNAPYYLMVNAAGNSGNQSFNALPLDGNITYDKLSSATTSKNPMVVANASDLSVDSIGEITSEATISNSSSQGPTDDYRIKPDITGNGTGVFSCIASSDSDYASLSGTSMASPNIVGSLLLLQQLYNQENGNFMRSATLKGLALHTADDILDDGPDAISGWGYMNTKVAAELILNDEFILEEKTLNDGETFSFQVTVIGGEPLIASISWTDPPSNNVNFGTANETSPVLVNDLDIRISKNTLEYEPWKLTSVNTNGKGDNIVDPFEKIEIKNVNGTYTITISHKGSLVNGSQDYSLLVSGIVSSSVSVDTNTIKPYQIYPNPAKDYVTISYDADKYAVKIFNILGELVLSKTVDNNIYDSNILNISDLSSGIYSVSLYHNNNTFISKLIIK